MPVTVRVCVCLMVNSLASPAAIWDKHVKFCVQVDDVLKPSVGLERLEASSCS